MGGSRKSNLRVAGLLGQNHSWTIRPAALEDAPAIARVRVASWQTTYRGLLPDPYLDSLNVSEFTRTWSGILRYHNTQDYAFVAEDSQGSIVGFALGGPNRGNYTQYQAELYAIYLLQPVQHQGLGRCLVAEVASKLLEHQLYSMIVWVLSTNPARGFYERLGGKLFVEKGSTLGRQVITEVAYGWEDIHDLALPSD